MTPTQEIAELRTALQRHNHNYYVLNAPEISDMEFDRLMHRLQELEAAHPECFDPDSPTQRVGSDLNAEFVQVEHRYPMLSLANTYNREEVAEFFGRVRQGLQDDAFEICCELKFDGLSISLIYEQGRLRRAVTRGDGVRGDDVTANVRTIRSVPLCLPDGCPDELEIRGEVLMPWQSFEELNLRREAEGEPLFANPRNAASGTLKSKNPAVVAARKLDAFLYYLPGQPFAEDGHYEKLCMARDLGFKVSDAMRKVSTLEEVYAYIDYWDQARKNLPFATDGIVLKVNSCRQQQALGYTAKTPRWAIAYKFQPERACTRLEEVTFQVGRTGTVTPVANMQPVHLAGTVVKRATLHNHDFMMNLDLHIGDMVYVEKGGEIIPKIVGVDLKSRVQASEEPVAFPACCPECGTPLVRSEGEAAWYCPNESSCPPQVKGRIEHFISRKAMCIDSLGPETVDDYYHNGLIGDAADLYDLRVEQLSGADGTRIKSAQKIIDSIARSKEVPFERVLFALGIRFVGEIAAKTLARHFHDIDALMRATVEELTQVDGIGMVIAQSVIHYFADAHNRHMVERLRGYGVRMELDASVAQPLGNSLEGKNVVVSGVFALHSREEYKLLIEQHGGKNTSSISAKTSYVLAGANMGPAKLEKASKLGIPIISEEEFLELIQQTK